MKATFRILLTTMVLAVCTFWSSGLHAQAIEGKIRAAGGGAIEGALVRLFDASGSQRDSAVTTTAGEFRVLAPGTGRYRVIVNHPGYRPLDSGLIDLGRAAVTLNLQLDVDAIALDSLVVSGRRRDRRNEASYEGFYTRRELFPSVGPRRAVSYSDAPLLAALRVSDAILWFGLARPCRIVWWNGSLIHNPMLAEHYLDDSASALEGLEFYRTWDYAPLMLRDAPAYVHDPWHCSVIVLWPKRPGVK